MKKILIQMGHAGRTSGATGAPEEQKWTMEIVPKMAQELRNKGFEVATCNADPTNADIAGDWDLFLAVHYDSDSYNNRGGFIDTPEPSTDFATVESNRIASEIIKTYFSTTGIPEYPKRSNANTRFYYMWSRMSAKTPCVLLEAGVGFRLKEDHNTLWFEQDKVVKGVVDGIVNALGESKPIEPVNPCEKYEIEIEKLKEENKALAKQLEECQKNCNEESTAIAPQFIGWEDNGMQVKVEDKVFNYSKK